jgi:hypothetical protein
VAALAAISIASTVACELLMPTDADLGLGGSASHGVRLAWKPSVTPGVTYATYRSDGCTGSYVKKASGLTDTNWTDTAVARGATYCYVTTAVDTKGESVNSNPAQAVIP